MILKNIAMMALVEMSIFSTDIFGTVIVFLTDLFMVGGMAGAGVCVVIVHV